MSATPPSAAFIIGTQIVGQLINGLICWFIWKHYRKARHSTDLKYRTFWPRLFSRWVDSLVFAPITMAFVILSTCFTLDSAVHAIAQLLFVVGWAVYVIEMHRRYGQTLGKMACKVKLVDHASETQVTAKQAYLREGIPLLIGGCANIYFIYLIGSGRFSHDPQQARQNMSIFKDPVYIAVTSIPVIWFVIEVITMLFNSKRRALHDFIAGTVIVRTSVDEAPPLPSDAIA